jgi:GT2 family glycosyltransferase
LSAGKPVVSTRLEETSNFVDFIELAETKEEWETAIIKCLAEEKSQELMQYRYSYAKQNTWKIRAKKYLQELHDLFPKISIIIVTYNQLAYTQLCVESILRNTSYPNYEIIIVDNGSTDGSLEYLQSMTAEDKKIVLVENQNNLGFVKAINIGYHQSEGEYLILLNNDVIVTPGWVHRLVNHLKDNPTIGMVGPVTNSIGNEAKVSVTYQELEEINQFSVTRMMRHSGRSFELNVLALYCCMISRSLFERVGGLDERYEIGFFEDDDLAMKIKKEGFTLICAEDVFVHHFHGMTFKDLPSEKFDAIFNANLARFESKWDTKWKPHEYRINSD